jgi:hypothetical protein
MVGTARCGTLKRRDASSLPEASCRSTHRPVSDLYMLHGPVACQVGRSERTKGQEGVSRMDRIGQGRVTLDIEQVLRKEHDKASRSDVYHSHKALRRHKPRKHTNSLQLLTDRIDFHIENVQSNDALDHLLESKTPFHRLLRMPAHARLCHSNIGTSP